MENLLNQKFDIMKNIEETLQTTKSYEEFIKIKLLISGMDS